MRTAKRKYIKAGYCLAGFIMACMHAFGQYTVSGEVLDVDYQYGDVSISLSNGPNVKHIKISNTGKFITSLDWNKTYTFSFYKPGYVSKIIEFSTHLPTNVPRNVIEPYDMQVRLFKVFDGVDTVFFKNPVAKIRYDKNKKRTNGGYGDFAHDVDYSLKVKYLTEQMRQKGTQKNKERVHVEEIKKTKVKSGTTEQVQTSKNKPASNVHSTVVVAEDKTIPELNGVPALKAIYPKGETVEQFNLETREVTRHVFVMDAQRRVFLSVKHNWGGHYYFIDEADIGFRCISKEVYNHVIAKCRTKIENNK
ncbi:MAG: hypothetical protein N4A74_21165 [Carboxylicivirga sp.]|nr:hypothetical protein [Carboxylicivirga sp.]